MLTSISRICYCSGWLGIIVFSVPFLITGGGEYHFVMLIAVIIMIAGAVVKYWNIKLAGVFMLAWLAGAMLNATAIVANGGYMPVRGREYHSGIHGPLTEQSNLIFLCDVLLYSSIGDVFIITGLIGYMVYLVLFEIDRKKKPLWQSVWLKDKDHGPITH